MDRMKLSGNEEAKKYAFNRKETVRKGLINTIKKRRRNIISKDTNSNNHGKSKELYKKTNSNKSDNQNLIYLKSEVTKEEGRNSYFRATLSDFAISEMEKKKSVDAKSQQFRNNYLKQSDSKEKNEETKQKKAKEDRRIFSEKSKVETKEQKKKEEYQQKQELEKMNVIQENNKKITKVVEKGNYLAKQQKQEYMKKIQDHDKRLNNFENVEKKKIMHEKIMRVKPLNDRCDIVRGNADQLKQFDDVERMKLYITLCKKQDDTETRMKKNMHRITRNIHKNLEEKDEKVKEYREIIKKQDEERTQEILLRRNLKTQNGKKIKEEIKNKRELKRHMTDIDMDIAYKNYKRIQKMDEELAKQRQETIENKNKKISKLLMDRQEQVNKNKHELYKSETKRETIRQALNMMAIWNSWDIDVLEDIIKQNKNCYEITEIQKSILRNRTKNKTWYATETGSTLSGFMTPKLESKKTKANHTTQSSFTPRASNNFNHRKLKAI